jgi:hypothetical protein
MNNQLAYASNTPNLLFTVMCITAIAAALGLYGFYTILSLAKAPSTEPRGIYDERLMIGLFNVFISLFAMFAIVFIMQFNASEIFNQYHKLLGQFK